MGVAFAPMFIDSDPAKATIDRVVDHILYVRDLVGIDTVGNRHRLRWPRRRTVPVVPEVSQLVHLTRAMLSRGLTERRRDSENLGRKFPAGVPEDNRQGKRRRDKASCFPAHFRTTGNGRGEETCFLKNKGFGRLTGKAVEYRFPHARYKRLQKSGLSPFFVNGFHQFIGGDDLLLNCDVIGKFYLTAQPYPFKRGRKKNWKTQQPGVLLIAEIHISYYSCKNRTFRCLPA